MGFGSLGSRSFGRMGGGVWGVKTPTYDPDAKAYFEAVVASGGPAFSAADKALWNAAVLGWKAAGTWELRDCIQIIAAPSQIAAQLNIKNPSLFIASFVNTPTFTPYRGVVGDGVQSYYGTNWAPNAAGNIASLNSINAAFGTRTEGQGNLDMASATRAGGDFSLSARTTANQQICRVNDSTNGATSNSVAVGESSLNRSDAAARQMFKNGAQTFSDTTASTTISQVAVTLGRATTSYGTRQYTHFMAGGSLTTQQKADEWAVTLILMQAIGAF